MAADLHIHVITGDWGIPDMEAFFGKVLGSKYFAGFRGNHLPFEAEMAMLKKLQENTDDIWIGEVSWLKAALFEENPDIVSESDFIPNSIKGISELIGEDLPELTNELKEDIIAELYRPNSTGYDLATPTEVDSFLSKHIGKKLFTVSW